MSPSSHPGSRSGSGAGHRTRPAVRLLTPLVAAGLLLGACGSGDEPEAGAGADGAAVDVTEPVVDAVPTGSVAGTVDTESDADVVDAAEEDGGGERLAMVESEADASAMGGIDAALAEISACLEAEGTEVGELTLADMLTKAQGDVPADGDIVQIFAFFLDRDPTDETFIVAVGACEDVVYAAPGIAAFLPPQG